MNALRPPCVPATAEAGTGFQALVRVLAISDTDIELQAVEAGSVSGCAQCDQGQGCGQALLVRLRRKPDAVLRFSQQDLVYPQDWLVPPAEGAICRLEVGNSALLKLTLLLYGLPLAGLLVGTGLVFALLGGLGLDVGALQQDGLCAAGGLSGMIFCVRMVNNLSLPGYCDVRLYPQI